MSAVVASFAVVPAAAAAPAKGLSLTVVARECPTYQDISANLLRNNLMESLRDLGPDTTYGAGALMDPQVEATAQPNCSPLPNWTFTLGEDIKAPQGESKEPWGALSIVLRPFATDLTTAAKTALLDSAGRPTGQTIAGATTVQLTNAEAKLASRGSLWIQGGTPTDPVLAQRFPGPLYGFGALRCAIDNVNGDNVEYVSYPAGVTHVFCFAYYVKPPPTSGTIVIRKEVDGLPGVSESFPFDGNVSYEPGGVFSLDVEDGQPAEERFFRGATGSGEPWRVREREREVPDWRLTELNCTSRDGASSFTTSVQSGEAQITLAGGDLVTCTYLNRYAPPPRGLALRKITRGGIGSFGFEVTPVGGGETSRAEATTEEEEVAVDADPSPLDLAPGRYDVIETLPSSNRGRWELTGVQCEGRQRQNIARVEIELPADQASVCTFTNTFIPRGSITISKVTYGAVGSSSFLVARRGDDPAAYRQTARTTEEGVAVRAVGDSTDELELGRYAIVDSPPPPGKGAWSLNFVQCDGRAVPFSQGRIEIELTAANPDQHCTFVNNFDRDPEPQPRPQRPSDPSPQANLVVAKTPSSQVTTVGSVVAYRLQVSNQGGAPAADVRVVDQPRGPVDLVSAETPGGTCGDGLPLICELGMLEPGQSKSVTVRLRVLHPGRFSNFAVTGTATKAGVGKAAAKVRVKGPPLPKFPGLG
ncbi:MAG TPA: DUF11 domain-containing protein [Solirubrobacterales bacterium]|nr:DUF11 domain-containing protein [Solirubrobacterales bacterium]